MMSPLSLRPRSRAFLLILVALAATAALLSFPVAAATYDSDGQIRFQWSAAAGFISSYRVYGSVDGGPYTLLLGTAQPSCTFSGENNRTYIVRVAALGTDGLEGPLSDPSDPVICDTVPPTAPTLSPTYVQNGSAVTVTLATPSTDAHFGNYQVFGGNYAAWTDTTETTTFQFTVNTSVATTVQVRGKDLAGHTGTAGSLVIPALAQKVSISGYVRTASAVAIPGVTMTFSNGGPTVTTAADGGYSGQVDKGWSGTVTPSKAGYSFSPASRSYSSVQSDQTGQHFTGTVLTFTISGSVQTSTGTAISGVTLTGLPGSPTTDANGAYTATVSYGWSGTVTPTKAGGTFTPASRTYSNVTSSKTGENYEGVIRTYTISGLVRTSAGEAVSDVALDGLPDTPTTDETGAYVATVPHGWSGTATPTKAGHVFTPTSRTYSNVIANATGHNYTATVQTFAIAGTTRTESGTALSGVTLTFTGGATRVTGTTGAYSASFQYGWSGSVVPHKVGLVFSPSERDYASLTHSESGQDFVAAQDPNDTDADGLPDDWERQIVEADPDDLITNVAQVRGTDDFDREGLTNAREYSLTTSPIDRDTDDDGALDDEEVTLGTDPLRGADCPVIYVHPAHAWSYAFWTLANSTDQRALALLQVYNASGLLRKEVTVAIPPKGAVSTWNIIGNPYTLAKPCVLRVLSDQVLVADDVHYGSNTQAAWAFSVEQTARAASTRFAFPIGGADGQNVYLATTGETPAQVTVEMHAADGTLLGTGSVTVPGRGTATGYAALQALSTISAPAFLIIDSDTPIVASDGRWNSKKTYGDGFNHLPETDSAGTEFFSALGALDRSFTLVGNPSPQSAAVTFTLYDAAGTVLLEQEFSVPGYGVVNTWDIVGNLSQYGLPVAVRIESAQPVVVEQCMYDHGLARGGGFDATPSREATSNQFVFGVWGLANSRVLICNPLPHAVNGTLSICRAAGDPVRTLSFTIPAHGTLDTWSLLGNLYAVVNPTVVRLNTSGTVVVAHHRWSTYRQWLVQPLPSLTDTDGDGMPDTWETAHGLNPQSDDAAADPDGDSVTNRQEYHSGTDPSLTDTDADGLSDPDEINTRGTNPALADTDGDGLLDGQEATDPGYGTDPLNPDTDADGLNDYDEVIVHHTNPTDADTDDDTVVDADELLMATDPTSAASAPAAYIVPLNDQTYASAVLVNSTNTACDVLARVFDASGAEKRRVWWRVPPSGLLNSYSALGNLYAIAKPATLHLLSRSPLKVTTYLWGTTDKSPWMYDVPETGRMAGTDFSIVCNGLSSAYLTIANATYTSAEVSLIVHDALGAQKETFTETVPAHGLVDTKPLLGNLYDSANPCLVRLTSTADVVVTRRLLDPSPQLSWSAAPLPSDVGAGTSFAFVVTGASSAFVTIGNASDTDASVTLRLYNTAGTPRAESTATVAARGVLSSWDLLGNLYPYANPVVVEVTSTQPVVVDAARWTSNSKPGRAEAIPPLTTGRSTLHTLSASGWSVAEAWIVNPADQPATAALSVFNPSGTLRRTASAITVPAHGAVSTQAVIGNLYTYAKPAAVWIATDGAVVVSVRTYASSTEWGATLVPLQQTLPAGN